MKLILASNNAHKLREFREILTPLGIEIIPQSEAGCHFEVDETGTTFEENAYLKAAAVTKATGLPAVADDSGLEVDALGGAPGIYSARYTGNHEDTDTDRLNLVLKNLGSTEHRTARFVGITRILSGRRQSDTDRTACICPAWGGLKVPP